MNGEFGKKIKDMIKEYVKNSTLAQQPIEHEKFKKELDLLMTQIHSIYLDVATNSRGMDLSKEELEEYITRHAERAIKQQNIPEKIVALKTSHSLLTNKIKSINNDIKQEVKHDILSKIRFLLFRVLTTFGIAGAVLAMAMFANSLGYETAILKKIDAVHVEGTPAGAIKKVDVRAINQLIKESSK